MLEQIKANKLMDGDYVLLEPPGSINVHPRNKRFHLYQVDQALPFEFSVKETGKTYPIDEETTVVIFNMY